MDLEIMYMEYSEDEMIGYILRRAHDRGKKLNFADVSLMLELHREFIDEKEKESTMDR